MQRGKDSSGVTGCQLHVSLDEPEDNRLGMAGKGKTLDKGARGLTYPETLAFR